MSSDLFAAFGDSSQQPLVSQGRSNAAGSAQHFSFFDDLTAPGTSSAQTQPQQRGQWPQSSYSSNFASNVVEQDEDFGDFEDASSTAKPPQANPVSASNDIWAQQTPTPSTQQYRGGTQTHPINAFPSGPSAFSSNLLDLQDVFSSPGAQQGTPERLDEVQAIPARASNPGSFSLSKISQAAHTSEKEEQGKLDRTGPDPDVLFDATQYDDDDDFGDFEGLASPSNTQAAQRQTQRLDTRSMEIQDTFGIFQPQKLSTSSQRNVSQANQAASNADLLGELDDRPSKVVKPGAASFQVPQPSQITSKAPVKPDDSWGEFDDWDTSAPVAPPSVKPDSSTTEGIISSIRPSSIPEPSSSDLPPTNIPPPAVVLSLFPPIFAEAQTKLFKPLAAQSYQLKNRILSDPVTIEFLRSYLLLAVVAARVIAGRKHRWKRDKHLSQGMRIGPASSRATSGMKLTGIDKGEDAKEDREVLDVVRAWKEQIGRLRSAAAGANSVGSAGLGSAFDLHEVMPVRTAKESEGGVRAPQPCALCGLKRDERVAKVDGEVQDSFGEWWIDQMSMHRGTFGKSTKRHFDSDESIDDIQLCYPTDDITCRECADTVTFASLSV